MDINTLIETFYSVYYERVQMIKNNDVNKSEKDTLHFFRVQLEPYIFNYLIHAYGQKLEEHWKYHVFPKTSNRAFVIVERRIHSNWWFVLRNIAWAGPNMSLYIFCSDINYEFIKSVLGDKADNVHIRIWFKGVADRETGFNEYNITFKMPHFYRLIDADYFINFQMDSYFLQKIPDWIFTGIYYGSPWHWSKERAGNGGLAVRNTKKLAELCEKEIQRIYDGRAEDDFISDAVLFLNSNPPFEFRVRVFQENYPSPYVPIGTHQFWTYLINYNMADRAFFSEEIKKLVTIHC